MIGLYEVLFVGGPMDGDVRALPGEDGPPLEVKIEILPAGWLRSALVRDDPEQVPTVLFVYDVKPSPADEGPAWIAVPRDPSWTAPLSKEEDTLWLRDQVTTEDFEEETRRHRPPREPRP